MIKIAPKKYYDKDIKIICVNGFKCRYYLILVDKMVDYKKQVFITKIKVNVQCLVCHISPKKQENLTKI